MSEVICTKPIPLCATCGSRLGAFISQASDEKLDLIWKVGGEATTATASSSDFVEWDRELKEFVRAVDEAEIGDAETHADLSRAYLEMGLRRDALREAGVAVAVASAKGVPPVAFAVIFDDKLVRVGGLALLRDALFPA